MEYIIEQELKISDFHRNLKVGDKVIVDLDDNNYREAIIESNSYAAPSSATYINILVPNKITSTEHRYAVPIWDLYPLGSKKIIYKAYIYSLNRIHGTSYNRQGSYELVCEGKRIKSDYCAGRKDANKKLLDVDLLKSYGINRVYSNGILIYDATENN